MDGVCEKSDGSVGGIGVGVLFILRASLQRVGGIADAVKATCKELGFRRTPGLAACQAYLS
ncbi:hypothetical protein JCM17961_08450 [Endothiovibrio diazotrophicus]